MEYTKSIYGIFIIESLTLNDEKENLMDGKILHQMLKLCDIPTIYHYIKTREEFNEKLQEFKKSNFRYLHLSMHGNTDELSFTFKPIKFSEFYNDVKDSINNRRLFLSACEATNHKLANYIFNLTGCASLIGSPENIRFDDSALFWSSFYHLMNKKYEKKEKNEKMMQLKEIDDTLEILTPVFQIKISYFSFVRNNKKRFGFKEFDKGNKSKRVYFNIE